MAGHDSFGLPEWFKLALVTTNEPVIVRSSVLYGAYREWCGNNEVRPTSSAHFGKRMAEAGIPSKVYHRDGKVFRAHRGLEFVDGYGVDPHGYRDEQRSSEEFSFYPQAEPGTLGE